MAVGVVLTVVEAEVKLCSWVVIAHSEEEEMTISSHKKGLEEGSIRKEDTKVKDKRKMSDEEYDKEVGELTVHLTLLKEMLQQNIEDQYYEWEMRRKKVKWSIEKLFNRKLNHKVNVWIMTLQAK